MNRPSPSPQVLVLGSLNMDLVVRVPRAPDAGETLAAHGFMTNPGGKGANQAVACARLGAAVGMVGRVGGDAFGEALRGALAADGIDVRHVATAGDASGIAVITVDDAGENRIAIVAGANARLAVADVEAIAADIAAAPLLLLQFEVPLPTVVRAARIARDAGRSVVLNPAPARALPDALWSTVDLLVVNETEAAMLAGTAVDDVPAARDAALALRRRGPARVVVTLGRDGAVVADAAGCRRFHALAVEAVDTTAAGDTFIGALCAGLAEGMALDAAIALGIRAAALCVTRPGAQASIPRRHEVAAMPEPAPPTSLA